MPFPRSPRGFSLIEVLIAVAVLAIGLLSVAALQIQGVRQNFDSYSRSQAVMLANDYVERIYANRPGAELGQYGNFDSDAVDCEADVPDPICGTQNDVATPVECTARELAQYDRYIVTCGYPTSTGRFGGVRDLLQQGRMIVGCINAAGADTACQPGLRHRIDMRWIEQVKDQTNRSSPDEQVADDLVITVQP